MTGSRFSKENTQEYWDRFSSSIKPSLNQIFNHMNQIELWDINYQDKLDLITNKIEKLISICQEKEDSSLLIQNSMLLITILSALNPSQFFYIIHYIDRNFPNDNIIIKFIQTCIENPLHKDSTIFIARVKTLNDLNLLTHILSTSKKNMVIVDYFLNDK